MNEDRRKILRTQGKYGDDRTSKEKRQKGSPSNVGSGSSEKKAQVAESSEKSLNQSNPWSDSSGVESPVRYEENSSYKFEKIEPTVPKHVDTPGITVISQTFHGESSILYEPQFIDLEEGNELYDCLIEQIAWDARDIIIRGESYPQPRLVAWYGPFAYTYSGLTLEASEIPDLILPLKGRIEDYLNNHGINVSFNSVLLNLYRSGHDSISWHSDDELSLGVCPTIASISLGETRKFEMRRKVGSYEEEIEQKDVEQLSIYLTHGSLFVMNGVMQRDWQHRVPKEYHDKDARINLTFRTIYSFEEGPPKPVEQVNRSKVVGIDSCMKSCGEKNFSVDDFPPLNDAATKSIKISLQTSSSARSVTIDDQPTNVKNEPLPVDPSDSKESEFSDDAGIDSKSNEKESDKEDSDPENPPFMKQFKNKMYADQIQSSLNVNALEFVPVIQSPTPSAEGSFDKLSFAELIVCEVDAFDKQNYLNYTDTLMKKMMENLSDFNSSTQEEIRFVADLMDGTKCPLADKLCRDRLCVLAKRINDKDFKFYGRNKPSRSPRDDQSYQRDFNYQRQRFLEGKPRNRDENFSQGDRVSTGNRRSYGSQNDRPYSHRKDSFNQKDQREATNRNPKRNSRGNDSWGDEKANQSSTSKNKEDAWTEDGLAKKSSVNDNINNWLEANMSQSDNRVGNNEDAWGDLSQVNTASKGEGTWDDNGSVNNTQKKDDSSWCDDNNADDHKRNLDRRDQTRYSNRKERHSDQSEESSGWKNENLHGGNRQEKAFDQGGRHFNRGNRFGPRNVDSSEQRENRGWKTGNMSRGSGQPKSFDRDRNFNRGNRFGPRNTSHGHFEQSDKPRRDTDDHSNWDTDRPGWKDNSTRGGRNYGGFKQTTAPRFANRRDTNQSNREDSNKDDFVPPSW